MNDEKWRMNNYCVPQCGTILIRRHSRHHNYSLFIIQYSLAQPAPTIILQITMLLFVKGEILYFDICFLFCVQIITKGADTPSHLQWRITDSDQLLILLYPLLLLKSRFWIIYCSWCTFYHAMYRPTESVDWCQCCQQGVSLTDFESSSDFFGNHNTP